MLSDWSRPFSVHKMLITILGLLNLQIIAIMC